MCYPSPGPRCAAHTKTAMVAAETRWAAATNALNLEDSPDNREAQRKAYEDYFRTQVDFTSTPRGQQLVTGAMNKAASEGRDTARFQALLDRGCQLRSRQMRGAVISDLQALSTPTESINPRIKGTRISMSPHAMSVAVDKGFDAHEIAAAFKTPEKVYDSGSHPGQVRVTGNGMCLVGERQGNSFNVITIYLDGVVTAPRADQSANAEGRDFASRYQQHGPNAR